jgi:hypothetical protein
MYYAILGIEKLIEEKKQEWGACVMDDTKDNDDARDIDTEITQMRNELRSLRLMNCLDSMAKRTHLETLEQQLEHLKSQEADVQIDRLSLEKEIRILSQKVKVTI